MNKTQLQQLVKEHLALINQSSLDQARLTLRPDQWQSFWDIIADRLIDQVKQELLEKELMNNYAPEATWREAWDLIERHYAQYVLEPVCKNLSLS